MSPSALHPHSRQTLSLFTTTLAVAFLVIGMPHILPCPAPRAVYAESAAAAGSNHETTTARRRGAAALDKPPSSETRSSPHDGATTENDNEAMAVPRRAQRECPVPKPTGLLGQVLGFRAREEVKRRGVDEK